MAIVFVAIRIAKDAGEEADNGIGYDEAGEFASGEDVVANCVSAVGNLRADALINPFVVTADEDKVPVGREFSGGGLRETVAHWVGKDDSGVLGVEGIYGLFDKRGHHDHSRAASIGSVIYFAMVIGGEVSGV